MRPRSPAHRLIGSISALLCAATVLPILAQTCTTTITGKVYSPNGVDPLPNILVYVPTTAVQPLPAGLSTCAAASQLVSGNPLVSTTTAADGTFSLTSPQLAGTQTLVIQAGKWRRQYPNVVINACQINIAPTLAMPQNQSQGDIPHIALSTGSSDAIECVLRKIGISDSEFTAAGGTGRISLYAGSQSPGITTDASGTALPSETTLVSSQAALDANDLTIFACQGTDTNPAAANTTNQQDVVDYANVGGRVFATHYSYVWLNNSTVFAGVANWVKDSTISGSTTVPIDATIDQSYAEGVILANWLYDIGATPVKGQLPLYVTKKDQTGINPPAQSWATLNDPAVGSTVMQFTFDTPISATTTPTVSLGFTNTPSTAFAPGDAADSVTINVTDTSTTTAADATLNLTLLLPPGLTARTLAGANAGTGWVCSASTLTCNRTTALAAGTSDPVLLVVSVSPTAPLGDAVLTATVAGGGLSGTNQCGRVLFNEYHVETVSFSSKTFPNECEPTAMTPQEKFLEFSLYNLSNFIAPAGNDIIDIQAPTTLTWPTPAGVLYGPALSGTQLDATATYNGVAVPGTFVYAPAAGTIPNTGTDTLSGTFTPTDPTSYTTVTGTTTLVVTQDTTTTTLSSGINPSVLNQSVTFTATVTGSNAAPTGSVNFYDGTTQIGTGTLTAGTGNVSTATFSTSILTLGSHNIIASYANTLNFGPSSSATLVQVVNLIPSSITITGLISPIYYGQIIGNTAIINVVGFSSGGFSKVYIDNVLVCTLPVIAGATQSCPASTGAGYNSGTHTIYATYTGDAEYAPSTTPTYTVLIQPDNTVTTLISSNNPILTTQTTTFTATVTAPYAPPVGSVTFFDGATPLATVPVNAQGVASFTTALPAGADNIIASYPASQNFNASSSSLTEQVNIPMPRFSLTVTPNPLNILVNTAGVATVTTTDIEGFSQPVQLTCSGLPAETTCAFTQSLLPATGGSTQVTLTPAPPHNCKVATAELPAPTGPGSGLWLAVVGLTLLFARRRRRLLQGLTLAVALFFLPVINGCGNCTDLGVLPGAYSITITGTSTGTPVLTSSVVVTMNVTY